MSGTLSRFRIEDLHNFRTIDLNIKNNRIVLVGENGTGKSTVANFIYFFLTRQWRRLLDYDFRYILAVIDEKEIRIDRDDLVKIAAGTRHRLTPSQRQRLEYILRRELIDESRLLDKDYVYYLAHRTDIAPHILYEFIRGRQHDPWQPFSPSPRPSKETDEIEEFLNKSIKYQILYLPTYRRIEQDLRTIFPGLEDEIKRIQQRQKQRVEHSGYIEFVEFGMEDVEKAIQQKMEELKDNVRNGLNRLTGTYMRDVILGTYKAEDLLPKITVLGEQTVNAIFTRIPTEILPEEEQNKLRKIITDIKRRDRILEREKVIAHFLSQLIELHLGQQKDEKKIWQFVEVCNEYLMPTKKIIYDNASFEIYVQQLETTKNSQKLTLRDLSSGEKQIVSLFSHIYLSGGRGYFVIIDEPELSLSVPWQKRFLPDILKTKLCKGLVAATHSPFIYDNQLEINTHSLEEFIESFEDVS